MSEIQKTESKDSALGINFTIKNLFEAGVHFGHKTSRRNCKMSKYIHSNRNGLSIIDLTKSAKNLHDSLKVVKEVVKSNGKILFVGTKKQAKDSIKEAATRCGQYYVSEKWLGGLLTNWRTSVQSIKKLKKIEREIEDNASTNNLNKKELLLLERKRKKLEDLFGGIRDMKGYPDLVFFIDVRKENIAIQECKRLKIPRMSILDTNCDPDNSTYIIPGNDDSARAIKLYCRLVSDAVLLGIAQQAKLSGSSEEATKDIIKKSNKKPSEVNEKKNRASATDSKEKKSSAKKEVKVKNL